MKNQQFVMTGLGRMELQDCPMPVPAPGEVVIEIHYVGICGSDLHFFRFGRIGSKVIDRPFVLGHECAGVVTAVGEGVSGFAPGDRVVPEPGVPCGGCALCRSGKYNLCPDMRFLASPPNDGCLRRYMAYPARMVFHLPDAVPLLYGAMAEPLAVGLHATRMGRAGLGKSAVILGGGPIGMMTLLACRAMGVTQVIVADLFEKRLENAVRLGAQETVLASGTDTAEAVLERTGGAGADLVFETAGSPVTLRQACRCVARGGRIVLVGNQTEPVTLDLMPLMVREASIHPIYRYRNLFPVAIEALAAGRIDLSLAEPSIFPFEQSEYAFQYTTEHGQSIIKSVIELVPENRTEVVSQ